MGKRKSRAKPQQKKKVKLDTVFNCPFCNHNSSVECYISIKDFHGEASCNICKESYNTTINHLTEAIDIYSEWIDECELANRREEDDDNS